MVLDGQRHTYREQDTHRPPDLSNVPEAQPGQKSWGTGREASLTLELLSTPSGTSGLAAFDPLPTPRVLREVQPQRGDLLTGP
jgi:hypothetical protein